MSFDAGSIEATLTLDRKPFIAGLKKARQDAKDFARQKYTATIDVNIDAAGVREQIDALAKDKRTHIKVDVESSQLRQGARAVGLFDSKLTKLAAGLWSVKTIGGAVTSLLAPAKWLAMGTGILGAAGAVTALTGGAYALAGVLSQVVGLAPLLVGGFAAVGSVFATVKLATSGIGQAFKDMAKGGKAFQQDLKNLAPSARQFVLEVKSLQPAFKALQQSVQQRFFAGVARDVHTLATRFLPQLKVGLGDVATSINSVMHGATMALSSGALGTGLAPMLHNVALSVRALQPGVASLVFAFSRLAVVTSGFLPQLARGFSQAAIKFDNLIQSAAQSGKLQAFIQRGIDAARTLLSIVGNLGAGFAHVAQAAAPLGELLLGKLRLVSIAFNEITKSASGQQGLQQFFNSLAPVLSSIGHLLATLGRAIRPLIPALLQIATILGNQLSNVVKALAPGLLAFSSIIMGLLPSIGRIATALGAGLSRAMIGLLPLIKPVAAAFDALAPVLGHLVSDILTPFPTLIGVIARVLQNLAPVLTPLVKLFGTLINTLITALAPVIIEVSKLLATALLSALNALKPVLPSLVRSLGQIIKAFAQIIKTAGPPIVKLFANLLAALLPAVPALVQLTLAFTPLVILLAQAGAAVATFLSALSPTQLAAVAVAVGLLMTAFNPLYGIVLTFTALFAIFEKGPIWAKVLAGMAIAVGGLTLAVWGLNAAIEANPVVAIITAIVAAIALLALGIYELVKHFGAVVHFFGTTLPHAFEAAGRAISHGLLAGINAAWPAVSKFFTRVGSRVATAFRGAGGWLVARGRQIIGGLVGGLSSAWHTVSGFLTRSAARVIGYFRGAGGWLSSRGRQIISGLIHGILSAWRTVSGWLSSVKGRIVNAFRGAANWLASRGRQIISGLTSGILSAYRTVSGWFGRSAARFSGYFRGAARWLASRGSQIVLGLWHGITSAYRTVSGWMGRFAARMSGYFRGAVNWLSTRGRQIISGLLHGILSAYRTVNAWLTAMRRRVDGYFRGAVNWLLNRGHEIIAGAWHGMQQAYNTVHRWFRGMKTRVLGYFRGASGWLTNAGKAMVNGLATGVRSAFGKVRGLFKSGLSWIINNVINRFLGLVEKIPGVPNNLKVKNPFNRYMGGPVRPGEWSWVGEKGPELAQVLPGGGVHIYSNEQSKKMTGGRGPSQTPHIPGFFLGGVLGKIKDFAHWTFKAGVKGLRTVTGAVVGAGVRSAIKLANLAIGAMPFPNIMKKIADGVMNKVANGVENFIKGKGSKPDSGGQIKYRAGAGVAQWGPAVLQALRMLGQGAGWLGTVLRRLNQESGGNPNAVNLWDSNAKAGHPSVGLMQVIAGTFRAFAGPFLRRGPFKYGVSINPLANIFAGLNYAIHRYGSLAALNRAGGYDVGGNLLPGATLAMNWTGVKERVLNPRETTAYNKGQLNNQTIDYEALAGVMAVAVAQALDGMGINLDGRKVGKMQMDFMKSQGWLK